MHLTICWCVVWDWHKEIHNLAIQQTRREFCQSDREVWREVRRWSTSVIQQLHDCLSDREGRGHSQTNSQTTQLILAFSLLEYTVSWRMSTKTNKQTNKKTDERNWNMFLQSILRGIWIGGQQERAASVLRYLCSRSSTPYGKHSDVIASPKHV